MLIGINTLDFTNSKVLSLTRHIINLKEKMLEIIIVRHLLWVDLCPTKIDILKS